MSDGKTPVWVWIGVGCLLTVVVAVGSVAGLVWFGVQKAKKFGEEMKNPETRAAKVATVLGTTKYPPGYYPAFSFSVPFVMQMAVLSDQPAKPGGEPDVGDRGFVFVDSRDFGKDQNELARYLRGEIDRTSFFERTHLRLGGGREMRVGQGPGARPRHLRRRPRAPAAQVHMRPPAAARSNDGGHDAPATPRDRDDDARRLPGQRRPPAHRHLVRPRSGAREAPRRARARRHPGRPERDPGLPGLPAPVSGMIAEAGAPIRRSIASVDSSGAVPRLGPPRQPAR